MRFLSGEGIIYRKARYRVRRPLCSIPPIGYSGASLFSFRMVRQISAMLVHGQATKEAPEWSGLNRVRRVVGTAHQRTRFDVREAHSEPCLPELGEFSGIDV